MLGDPKRVGCMAMRQSSHLCHEGGFAIVDREELAFFCEKHVANEVCR